MQSKQNVRAEIIQYFLALQSKMHFWNQTQQIFD